MTELDWPQSRYLRFELAEQAARKTERLLIYSQRTGTLLAEIKWFGPWRQYAFFPNAAADTVWNPECLVDVTKAIAALTARRRRVRVL